jgi:hypothetical protein
VERVQNTVSDVVDQLFPPVRPEPVPGCKECLGITVKGANARSIGDHSRVSDANVVLRTHLREDHGAE